MLKLNHKNVSAAQLYHNGFTLIELLVVVLIIGILAAIAVPQYQKSVIKARIARVLPQLKAIQDAQERFFMQNGRYTTDKEELDIDWTTQGIEAHSGFSMNANKVSYTMTEGPGISRCYQFANRAEDNTCPEVARGKFVCNGYGSDFNKQICLSYSTNTTYPWTDYITYW